MNAGKLDQRIAVDESVTDQNDTGEEIVIWTERIVVWGRIHPLNGRERLEANAINANIDVRISLRWSPLLDDMTAKWRLRHLNKGGVVYNVIGPPSNIDMHNQEIEVIANTGLNQG